VAQSISLRRFVALFPLIAVAVAGCQPPPHPAPAPPPAAAQPHRCLLPAEQRMLVAELFFGRSIRGRAPLTEAEWSAFAADTITPNFPDGFTVFDGAGQWQNPKTGQIGRERTKILLVAAKRDPSLQSRLAAVIDAYKVRFHQQSVGIITRDSCGAF
jgi:hypothetical protein